MNIYSIYRATNIINGKVYIGYTSNLEQRKAWHLADSAVHDTKFYRAIRKYGWDNFLWDIIYQSKDKKYTKNTIEKLLIKEYNSQATGYNTTSGGDGNDSPKTEKWKKNQSVLMAERYAIGVHNFTDELRQKIVDDGKNLLYGNSEWHRKNAYTQLNNNRHVSQMSKTCEHCGITCSANNYVRHHGAKCFALTGVKNKVSKHKKRQQLTCEQCEKTMDASNFKQHNHGPNCTRKKLNRVVFHSG